MIDDDEELAITQKQLALVEKIVQGWREKLLPHNPKNFAIYAEGAIEQAEILRAEIGEYLACQQAKVPDSTAISTTAPGQAANVP